MYALYLPAWFGSLSPCGSWQSTHFGVNTQTELSGLITAELWRLASVVAWHFAHSVLMSVGFTVAVDWILNGLVAFPCATLAVLQAVILFRPVTLPAPVLLEYL